MPEQDPHNQVTQTPEQAPGAFRNMFDAVRSFPQVVALEHHLTNRSQDAERVTAIVAGTLALAAGGAVAATSEKEAVAQEPEINVAIAAKNCTDSAVGYSRQGGFGFKKTMSASSPAIRMRNIKEVREHNILIHDPAPVTAAGYSPEVDNPESCNPFGSRTYKVWASMQTDNGRWKRVSNVIVAAKNSNKEIDEEMYKLKLTQNYTCREGKAERGFVIKKKETAHYPPEKRQTATAETGFPFLNYKFKTC